MPAITAEKLNENVGALVHGVDCERQTCPKLKFV